MNLGDLFCWTIGMILIGIGIGVWLSMLCSTNSNSKSSIIDGSSNREEDADAISELDWEAKILHDSDAWKDR